MTMYRLITKIGHSLGKRVFWRQHLREAVRQLQEFRDQLPTEAMLLTLPLLFRGKGYYRTLGMKQNLVELQSFVQFLEPQKVSSALEIGTMKGGTLYLWCQLSDPRARIYSIDLPRGRFGGGYSSKLELLFHQFKQPNQELLCIQGDSHSAATRTSFERALNGRSIDFLFIDGDHTYSGVKRDFEDYSPYVRQGGIVAFHDIVFNPANSSDFEVWRFWQELKKSHPDAVEFIDPPNAQRRTIGIGAFRKNW